MQSCARNVKISNFMRGKYYTKKLIILSIYCLSIIKIRLKLDQSINGFETHKPNPPHVSDLRRSQSRILPRTVFLTICDCRPIRCTSHGPVYGYSLPLQSGRRGPVVLFISRLWQRERSYNETNRPRLPREQWSRSAVRS